MRLQSHGICSLTALEAFLQKVYRHFGRIPVESRKTIKMAAGQIQRKKKISNLNQIKRPL